MMFSSAQMNTKPSKVSRNESVARLTESLKRREELTSKAIKVVEILIDNPVSEDKLQQCCKQINQFYYKDLIEERALVLNCGYPLCSNKLEKIKPQQFHISVRRNKIFDITERKNFCSNICYKASKYLENQLSTSELWLKSVMKIKFLPLDSKQGVPGEEVDLGEVKCVRVDDLCLESDHEIQEDELVEGLKAVSLPDSVESDKTLRNDVERLSKAKSTKDHKLQMIAKVSNDKSDLLSFVEILERTLKEWLTLESAKYLFGADKYEEFIKNASDVERCKVDVETIRKEIEEELFQKLDIQERDDEILDRKIIRGESRSVYAQRKRVPPSYDQMLKDGDTFKLKVQAYYEGTLNDGPLATTTRKTKEIENVKLLEGSGNDGTNLNAEEIVDRNLKIASNIVFPVVNRNEQNAIRRKIVLEKLNVASAALLQVMDLSYGDISSDLRMLVHTCRLTATNIMFKTVEWKTFAFVMIQMLTFRSVEIRTAFRTESTTKYVNSHFKELKLDGNYLDDLVDRVLSVESLTAPRKDLDS